MKSVVKFVLGVGLWVGLACASYLPAGPAQSLLQGMVYSLDRLPVAEVNVKVLRTGNQIGTTRTDSNGRFALDRVESGPLEIQLEKAGFEPMVLNLNFGTTTQVLYAQIINGPQLNKLALEALERKEWQKAADLMARSLKLDKDDPEALYLQAFQAYLTGDGAAASTILQTLLKNPATAFSARILLADISEKLYNDPAGAKVHLQEALKIRFDSAVDVRLKGMK